MVMECRMGMGGRGDKGVAGQLVFIFEGRLRAFMWVGLLFARVWCWEAGKSRRCLRGPICNNCLSLYIWGVIRYVHSNSGIVLGPALQSWPCLATSDSYTDARIQNLPRLMNSTGNVNRSLTRDALLPVSPAHNTIMDALT